MRAARVVAVIVAILLVLLDSRAFAGELPSGFTREPVPPWVVPPPPMDVSVRSEDRDDRGAFDRLFDAQIKVGPSVETYTHHIQEITNRAGVESLGQIELGIDPSYERVAIHRLEIVRDGQRFDALRTADIRSLDAEDERDRRVYQGERRLVIILSDLRVGDVIDIEVTTRGQNAVFGGRFAKKIGLSSSRPVLMRRVRLLAADARDIRVRTSNLVGPFAQIAAQTTRTRTGATEMVWAMDHVPVLDREDDSPDWYSPWPAVAVSEYASWEDVIAWALPLYIVKANAEPTLRAKVDEIARAHSDPEDRALAALRFVQEDVRYVGIELGESSHKPHAPARVLEQRFGDCKDKVMLLLALLKGLGIEAAAALVDTDLGSRIAEELPGPNVFDHVIARIRLRGRDVWVDPTARSEGGSLGSAPIRYGRALVIDRNTTSLSEIPRSPLAEPTRSEKQTFAIDGASAKLRVEIAYRGEDANSIRRALETRRRDIAKTHLEGLTPTYPGVAPVGDLVIEDDVRANVLVLRESYELPDAIEDGRLETWSAEIAGLMQLPKSTRRSAPLTLDFPSLVSHEIEVDGTDVEPPTETTIEDEFVRFTSRVRREAARVAVIYQLETKADHVPPAALEGHLATRRAIRDAIAAGFQLRAETTTEKTGYTSGDLVAIAIVVVFSVVVLVVGLLAAFHYVRRTGRRVRWIVRRSPGTGDTPAKAVRVASRIEAERRASRGSRPCGHRAVSDASSIRTSFVVFGGQNVMAVRASCPRCGDEQTKYFVAAQSNEDAVEITPDGGS